jgi:H+/Cl- antiporter ClcA
VVDADRTGPRLLAVSVLVGLAAGVGGAVLVLVLHGAQHLAYGYRSETFLVGVEQAAAARRVLALTVGGAVVGTGWWVLARWAGARTTVAHAVADPAGGMPVRATAVDAVLQVMAVGVGASLGREGAPRQVGAAVAGWMARRAGLGLHAQRTLLACGAGAGLAAVYDVPLAGVVFTLEVVLASARVRHLLPAALSAGVATVVAWPVVGRGPVYAVTPVTTTPALLVCALLLGPLAGVVGLGFVRLTGPVRRPGGWRLPAAVTAVLGALGGVAVVFPQLLGNGRGAAQLALDGTAPLPLLAVLLVLKPLVTAACLRGGVVGGLLTPALATGALLGAVAGRGWSVLWAGSPTGALVVVGAAAVLAATTAAPVTAVVLTLELTGSGPGVWLPVLLAVAGADLTRRAVRRRGDHLA